MAFKLDMNTSRRLDALQQSLTEARGVVEDEVARYNDTVAAAHTALAEKLEAYNEIVTETQGVIEDSANEMRAEFDEKSERWQESERGQEVSQWIDALETAQQEFEPVETPEHEDLDLNLPDHPDAIDQLERECPAS